VEARDSRKADPPTDKEKFETGKELYVVTLSKKIWAQDRIAVRADSEEEAARLALKGAHYDLTEWFICYDCEVLEDTEIDEVDTTTEEDVASDADQHHLLDDTLTKEVSPATQDDVDAEIAPRLAESDERAISNWKEKQVAVGRFLEELEDSGFFSGEWGEGRV